MNYLNDEYTLEIDKLGYKSQVEVIRDVIIDAETPFTIGISGRWGSGKTSIMKYLMASLGGEPIKSDLDFHTQENQDTKDHIEIFSKYEIESDDRKKFKTDIQTIWYNPWENEKHDEPLAILLQIMYDHFSTQFALL